METDLLKLEDEYRRENDKLELRTKELLKKVNDVMKIQDNLIRDSIITKEEIANHNKKLGSSFKNIQITGSSSKNPDKNLEIPDSVEEMGNKASSHFYRAKIRALQTENERIQCELKKRNDEFKKMQKENEVLGQEKEKWFSSYNTGKNTIGKLESHISMLNSKLQSKDSESCCLKKEVDQLKKELKAANLNLNSNEVRLNRCNEEIEKLRLALKNSREEEKDLRDNHKKQLSELQGSLKIIEKQKLEILNGFKKQLQLIDNLKKQKMNLEALKVSEVAECQYMKILDWKLD